jgi:metallophosphoesterase (TIGR00282 family)
VKLLFIGDIVAKPGRELLKRHLKAVAAFLEVDLVIANGENAAAGAGITRENAEEIFKAGVDVITSGNPVRDRREAHEFIVAVPRFIRPANYPAGTPGAGSYVAETAAGDRVGVINVMGRVFLAAIDDPFRAAEQEIARVREGGARIIFVDMHAETTSEKIALSWFLDGRVTAVVGTHTHVQTADERILPGGTACLTDVGMTGPHDGVIGMDRVTVIAKFVTGLPVRLEPAAGDNRLHGVVITADAETGRATAIERVALTEAQLQSLTVKAGAVQTQ